MVELVEKWLHLVMGYFFESVETESIGHGQKLTNFYNQLPNFWWNWSENDFILRKAIFSNQEKLNPLDKVKNWHIFPSNRRNISVKMVATISRLHVQQFVASREKRNRSGTVRKWPILQTYVEKILNVGRWKAIDQRRRKIDVDVAIERHQQQREIFFCWVVVNFSREDTK